VSKFVSIIGGDEAIARLQTAEIESSKGN